MLCALIRKACVWPEAAPGAWAHRDLPRLRPLKTEREDMQIQEIAKESRNQLRRNAGSKHCNEEKLRAPASMPRCHVRDDVRFTDNLWLNLMKAFGVAIRARVQRQLAARILRKLRVFAFLPIDWRVTCLRGARSPFNRLRASHVGVACRTEFAAFEFARQHFRQFAEIRKN